MKFHEMGPSGSQGVICRRVDTQTNVKKLICNFCNRFVNMSEHETQKFGTVRLIIIPSQSNPLDSLKNYDKYIGK